MEYWTKKQAINRILENIYAYSKDTKSIRLQIKEHSDIQKFIKWISKKPPEFNDSFVQANRGK